MRVNTVNNNQYQQNFGFKVKSVHLINVDATRMLRISNERDQELLLGSAEGFVQEAVAKAKKMIADGVKDLDISSKIKGIGSFFFRGTAEQPRIEDTILKHMQFAVKKDGEKYSLISYVRHLLTPSERKCLKVENWGVNPREEKACCRAGRCGSCGHTDVLDEPTLLTTTKTVEIEPENAEELAELSQMHAQIAENIAPFREHFKDVTGRDFPESHKIDGRVL